MALIPYPAAGQRITPSEGGVNRQGRDSPWAAFREKGLSDIVFLKKLAYQSLELFCPGNGIRFRQAIFKL